MIATRRARALERRDRELSEIVGHAERVDRWLAG
jgi:hypothetical protein